MVEFRGTHAKSGPGKILFKLLGSSYLSSWSSPVSRPSLLSRLPSPPSRIPFFIRQTHPSSLGPTFPSSRKPSGHLQHNPLFSLGFSDPGLYPQS